jgi:hypothetical protein
MPTGDDGSAVPAVADPPVVGEPASDAPASLATVAAAVGDGESTVGVGSEGGIGAVGEGVAEPGVDWGGTG